MLLCVFPVFADELHKCGNNKQAQLLVKLIIEDKDQNRVNIRCNSLLTEAAKAKAEKMADFGLVMHNLGGSPNSRLREVGYKLPKHYGHEFYLEQDEIGVAFVKKLESPHVEYWVVYLSKGYEKNQYYSGKADEIPNKSLFILTPSKK